MIQFGIIKYGIRFKDRTSRHTNRGDSVGSGSEEDGPGVDPLYCARCQDHFPDRAELLAHRACCKNRPPEDEDEAETTIEERTDEDQGKNTLELARHCQDVSNNNSVERDEVDLSEDCQNTQEPEGMILDEHKISPNAAAAAVAFPAASHVTLEALQNTKVAVAQFAATALANSADNEAALQELAVLQSTLFTLQHQQVFQLQLIQQLQNQLHADARPRNDDDAGCEDGPDREESLRSRSPSPAPAESAPASPAPSTTPPPQPNYSAPSTTSEEARPPSRTQIQPSSNMCGSISSSLASCIITHNDDQQSQEVPNTLEMLQRRAQEVLDSASQGLLAGNLADELAFRKSGKMSPYDSKNGGRNEPFFKHRCRYCGKVFGSDSALQIHIRSHTGERPFKCNVCGSRFTTKGNLKVHFQRHTAKFPHVKMNPNPIPEHLDKYHPPLLAQLSPGPSPNLQHPPQFPPAGHHHHFPIFRPALDLLRPPPPGIYTPIEQEAPADLSKPAPPSPIPSPRLVEQREEREENFISPKREPETERDPSPQRYSSPVPYDECSEDSKYSVPQEQEMPADLSSKAASPPSSASSMGDPTRDPALYSTLLPRPGSNDNSWESLIEVTRTSETSKLQRLVDNIETKLTDPNQCVVCHRVLSCKSALQMHYRTHTGERPFRCRICGRAFTTKGNLKTHMSVHRMKPPLRALHQCPVCHRKFSNALVLQQHIRLHTGEPTDLTPEQIRAAEVRDFPPLPGFPLSAFPGPGGFPLGLKPSDIEAMREAMMTDEDFGDDEDYPEDDDEENMKPEAVTSLAALENQVRTITTMASQLSASGLSQSAEDLSETKSQSASNTRPSSPVRSVEPQSPGSPAPSDCSQGGALDLTPRVTAPSPAFPNFSLMPPGPPPISSALSSLTSSVLTSTAFSPLGMAVGARGNTTCNICYKTFACNSALEIHYRSHTKERPFKCAVCDRGFSTKGNMKQHMLTHKIRDMPQHMFDNNVKSEDGSEPETRSPSLPPQPPPEQSVVKIEAGIKRPPSEMDMPSPKRPTTGLAPVPIPPPCPTLDLSPPRGPMLSSPGIPVSVHQHLQQSPLSQQSPLHQMSAMHQQQLTNISQQIPQPMQHSQQQQQSQPQSSKHLCGVCRKNFSSSSALQIHMRTHTGDKPFRCTVCQKAFTTKGNLKVHMGTHMWSNGASRRGRRMSLELPPRPLPLSPQDSDFLQRRPDLFYPYLPAPFLNGMQQKLNEISVIQQQNGPPHNGLPSPGKFAGLLGFGPFPPIPPPPVTKQEPLHSQPGSPLSDKPSSIHSPQPGMTQLAPGEREAIMRELGERERERERERESMLPRMWDLHYERKSASDVGPMGAQDDSSPMDVSSNSVPRLGQTPRGEGLAA